MTASCEDLKKRKKKLIVFAVIIFIGFFIFYSYCHPLYIYDSDDWNYISSSRKPWPSVNEFNPTKILPELITPLIAKLGTVIFYPITNDFVQSLNISFALVASISITLYFATLCYFLEKGCNNKHLLPFFITSLIVLYHFIQFSSINEYNAYILYSRSVNTTTNYLLPGMLNSILVMLFISRGKIWNKKSSFLSKGLLIIALYFCINSNMFDSIILISYVCSILLVDFWKNTREKNSWELLLKEHLCEWIILIAWMISLIFESQGGRAKGISVNNPDFVVVDTIKHFIRTLLKMNPIWIGFTVLSILTASYISFKDKKNEYNTLWYKTISKYASISSAVTIVYLILLSTKVATHYISYSYVTFAFFFWIVILVSCSMVVIFNKFKRIQITLPILSLTILVLLITDRERVFAENNFVNNYPIYSVKQIDDYIIQQVVEADEQDLDSVDVKIPFTEDKTWPLNMDYGGNLISRSLYQHKIIKNPIEVNLVMDQSVNERFGVN